MGYDDVICFGTDCPLDKLQYTKDEVFNGEYAKELFLKFKDDFIHCYSEEEFEKYYKYIVEFELRNILDTWDDF